jgi:hypothetical protein
MAVEATSPGYLGTGVVQPTLQPPRHQSAVGGLVQGFHFEFHPTRCICQPQRDTRRGGQVSLIDPQLQRKFAGPCETVERHPP